MIKFDSFDDALKQITMLRDLYWGVRVVNPDNKEVPLSLLPDFNAEKRSQCYKLREEGLICENCVSARALSENRIFIKFVGQKTKSIRSRQFRFQYAMKAW